MRLILLPGILLLTASTALAAADEAPPAEVARAALTIERAEITGGKLVVVGRAAAGATVMIEGTRRRARAGKDGAFQLSTTWRPTDCSLTLAVGKNTQQVLVGNCGPAGTDGKAGKPGPRGVTGPQGERGAVGARGAAGAPGAQGLAGPQGATGATGAAGPAGAFVGVTITSKVCTPAGAGWVAGGAAEPETSYCFAACPAGAEHAAGLSATVSDAFSDGQKAAQPAQSWFLPDNSVLSEALPENVWLAYTFTDVPAAQSPETTVTIACRAAGG